MVQQGPQREPRYRVSPASARSLPTVGWVLRAYARISMSAPWHQERRLRREQFRPSIRVPLVRHRRRCMQS
jgi:hypothetical protein